MLPRGFLSGPLQPIETCKSFRGECNREALGDLGVQVLSFCFFAAGKSTLLRISLYPGEFG